MTSVRQVYKCLVCGNMVEVVHQGKGNLVCCGKPMELQTENSINASQDKHVPIIEVSGGRTRVTVGRTAHPMDEDHWIEWVELMVENRVYRVYLRPGVPPEAEFPFEAPSAQARAYCNLHGLWASGVSG